MKEIVREVLVMEKELLRGSSDKDMAHQVSSLERKHQAVEKRLSSLKTALLVLIILSLLLLASTLLPAAGDVDGWVQKQTQKKVGVSQNHSRVIREFKEEMGDWKEEFRRRMQAAEKVNMKWECRGNEGQLLRGEYKGEVREGKPDGVGRFLHSNRKWKIEGEWEDGRLHGHAIKFDPNGDRLEYQVSEGRNDGQSIKYNRDGSHVYMEWEDG